MSTRARRRRPRIDPPPGTAVAYVRVSTEEQAQSGAGLDAQRAAIIAEADRRGWTITEWFTDEGISGSKLASERPGARGALEAVTSGQAAALLIAKLDRLGRSVYDLAGLIRQSEHEGWQLAACDGTVDTSTPAGRFHTHIMAGVAELERELISQRTREALAARKAAGMSLGTPTKVPDQVLLRIMRERGQGRSLRAIAAGLMADGIVTGSGNSTWHPPQVQRMLDCRRARVLAEMEEEQQ